MSIDLEQSRSKAILYAYTYASNLSLVANKLSLSIDELRALERIGGSVTEGYLRLVQDALSGGAGIEDIKSQAPDQIQRMLELELRGVNPDGEGELDRALKQQRGSKP